jgi:hypothetical protein
MPLEYTRASKNVERGSSRIVPPNMVILHLVSLLKVRAEASGPFLNIYHIFIVRDLFK